VVPRHTRNHDLVPGRLDSQRLTLARARRRKSPAATH
jgi:hypothetical protein